MRGWNPEPEKQVEPFLPLEDDDKGGKGDDPNHGSAHPSVPRCNLMVAEAKQPRRKREYGGNDAVQPIDRIVAGPVLKGLHGCHSLQAEH